MKKTFLLAFVFALPFVAHAALININTADATTLDTLPGIGPSKAAAIIDYRTQSGPFAKIEDIMNVSGIGPSTFTNIQSLISVSDGGSTPPPAASTSTPPTASTTPVIAPVPAQSGAGTPQYIPLPTLRLVATIPRNVSVGADTIFSVLVFDNLGHRRDDAFITWSFGDGMIRTGSDVLHTYYEAGEYLLVVSVSTPDGGSEDADFTIHADTAAVTISAVSSRGIALTNTESRPADLSLWRLRAAGKEFQLPPHTVLLANHTVTFASRVTELAAIDSAELLYPSGEIAFVYGAEKRLQPVASAASYNNVQRVVPAAQTNAPMYEKPAVVAPTAANTLAAVGAPFAPSVSDGIGSSSIRSGFLHSSWAYGLLGVLVVSGSAALIML